MNRPRVIRFVVLGILILTVLTACWFSFSNLRGRELAGESAQNRQRCAGRGSGRHHAIAPITYVSIYRFLFSSACPSGGCRFFRLRLWPDSRRDLDPGRGDDLGDGRVSFFAMARRRLVPSKSRRCIISKLQKIDENLGHNGLLRGDGRAHWMHFLPFAISNYLFGLTTITAMDVVIGTGLGNIPAAATYVAIGAPPASC